MDFRTRVGHSHSPYTHARHLAERIRPLHHLVDLQSGYIAVLGTAEERQPLDFVDHLFGNTLDNDKISRALRLGRLYRGLEFVAPSHTIALAGYETCESTRELRDGVVESRNIKTCGAEIDHHVEVV